MKVPSHRPFRAKTLVILGASGFANEVLWHMESAWHKYKSILFVDDVTNAETVWNKKLGTIKVIKDWKFPEDCEFIVGVGDPKAKMTMVGKALNAGIFPAPTFVHRLALVQDAIYGVGGIFTPGVVVTTGVTIGDYVVLNLNSTVGHGVNIGDFCTINPGCSVSGDTLLGKGVTLGTGAVTREKVKIAAGVMAGMQSAIAKDILTENITVVGIPAKSLVKDTK